MVAKIRNLHGKGKLRLPFSTETLLIIGEVISLPTYQLLQEGLKHHY